PSSARLLVEERSGRVEQLPRLDQGLEAGQDHHPAAVDLAVRVDRELVMDDGELAGVADLADLPGDPGRPDLLHLIAPQRGHALDETVRRIDLQVLASRDLDHPWDGRAVLGSLGPLRFGRHPEAVLRPHLRVGDRLPEALRGGLDVDLEHRGATAAVRVRDEPDAMRYLESLSHLLPPRVLVSGP